MKKNFPIVMLYLLFQLFIPSTKLHAVQSEQGLNVKIDGAGDWSVEDVNTGFLLNYKNSKGITFSNASLIESDFILSDLSLEETKKNIVSFVMNYPRDTYSFSFSSAEEPRILSACKQTTLKSFDDSQAAVNIVLCSKASVLGTESFAKLTTSELFNPNNLYLNGNAKVVIESNKVPLFNDDGSQMNNKPYLIKGDVVEVMDYKKSMLKIKYSTSKKSIIGWIGFVDIL